MKRNILKTVLIILMLFGMFLINNIYQSSNELVFINNECELQQSTRFTISMWVRPVNNEYYNKIFKLYNDKSSIYLLNNTEDDNYISTGITLTLDDKEISNSNNYHLNINEWSNIVICLDGRNIKVYLDGDKCLDSNLNTLFSNGGLRLKLFNEFEICDAKYYNHILNEKKTKDQFEENIEFKFASITYSNTYPYNSGKYSLNNVSFPVTYISKSDDLSFEANSFTLQENKTGNIKDHKYIAKITIGNSSYENEQYIRQNCNNEDNIIQTVTQNVKNRFNYYMSTSERLIFDNDVQVSCNVIKGNADYDNIEQKFSKRSNASEREKITIECTVKKSGKEGKFTKDIVLLDDYKGYLMVFFNGEDGWPMHLTGNEMLYFAYSEDLIDWNLLTYKPIVLANGGTGRFRDPYINRDKDGNFIITSTQGYYNSDIYLTISKDLSKFITTTVSINKYDSLLGLSGKTTWAPEFFYNQEKDMYTILYSEGENNNKGIYAVDTKNFNEFSYPYLYLYTGYNSIDANLTLINGNYYLLFKDERENSKDIYYAVTNNLATPLWNIKDVKGINGNNISEGPFIIKNIDNNEYYLYLDGFKLSTIYSGKVNTESGELSTNLEKDKTLNSMPLRIRHFSIVPITEKEYKNILNSCN